MQTRHFRTLSLKSSFSNLRKQRFSESCSVVLSSNIVRHRPCSQDIFSLFQSPFGFAQQVNYDRELVYQVSISEISHSAVFFFFFFFSQLSARPLSQLKSMNATTEKRSGKRTFEFALDLRRCILFQ